MRRCSNQKVDCDHIINRQRHLCDSGIGYRIQFLADFAFLLFVRFVSSAMTALLQFNERKSVRSSEWPIKQKNSFSAQLTTAKLQATLDNLLIISHN